MDTLSKLLEERCSYSRLSSPAPSPQLLKTLLKNSLNVPDHMHLRPWRFLSIREPDLEKLGLLFVKDAKTREPNIDNEELLNIQNKAQRAPLLLLAICRNIQHPKVPLIEQKISTGCVLNNLGLSLINEGFASIWRTGRFSESQIINEGLGLSAQESIVGYLYIGSKQGKSKTRKPIDMDYFLQDWKG